jgi:hypothetical protein
MISRFHVITIALNQEHVKYQTPGCNLLNARGMSSDCSKILGCISACFGKSSTFKLGAEGWSLLNPCANPNVPKYVPTTLLHSETISQTKLLKMHGVRPGEENSSKKIQSLDTAPLL